MSLNRWIGGGVLFAMSASVACGGLVAPGSSGIANPQNDAGATYDAGHSRPPVGADHDASVSPPPSYDDAGVGPSYPPSPPSTCAAAEPASFEMFPSANAVSARLQGNWILCSHSGEDFPALGPATQAGIVINGNHWNVLTRDTAGQLVAQTGFDLEGTIDILDVSSGAGRYQVNYVYGSGGTVLTQPTFSTSGSTMVLDNEGSQNTYVLTDEAVALPPSAPSGAHLGAKGCAFPGTSLENTFASLDDARSHLVGQWVDCHDSGNEQPFDPPGTDGIELTADGHWYYLTLVGATYQRGAGHTYDLLDTSSMNGPGFFQLNLDVGGGTQIVEFATADAPVKLHFESEGVLQATYSAL